MAAMSDLSLAQCTPPTAGRFGLSPTLQIVDDSAEVVGRTGICGPIDLVLDADDRLSTLMQIQHHMIVRLASRRLAEEDDPVEDRVASCGDRGGWWADAWRDRPIGSRLWVLDGERRNEQTRQKAIAIVDQALADLIDDGIVERFQFTPVYLAGDNVGTLALEPLEAIRPTRFADRDNWEWLWEASHGGE